MRICFFKKSFKKGGAGMLVKVAAEKENPRQMCKEEVDSDSLAEERRKERRGKWKESRRQKIPSSSLL